DLLGRGGPHHGVGGDLQLPALHPAVVQLHDPGRRGDQHLHLTGRPVGPDHRPPPAALPRGRPYRPGVPVEQPRPGLVRQERAAVVADADLLAVVELLDRRVAAAAPPPPQPDERQQRQHRRMRVRPATGRIVAVPVRVRRHRWSVQPRRWQRLTPPPRPTFTARETSPPASRPNPATRPPPNPISVTMTPPVVRGRPVAAPPWR